MACLGQSHIDGWFDPEYGAPEEAAQDRIRMYRHAQVRQGGPPWQGWQRVAGLAATVFGNAVGRGLDVPVGLLDYGVMAASLWQRNSLLGIFGWWLGDDSDVHPQSNNYSVFLNGLDAIGRGVEAVLWIQGHTDAMHGESTGRYQEGLRQFLATLRQDVHDPHLPVFFSLVARQGDAYGMGRVTPDRHIEAIRAAERQYIAEDPNAHLASTTMDLPLDDSNVHHAPAGQEKQAQRMALAVVSVLGPSPSPPYRGPQLVGFRPLDASTLAVTLRHVAGGDFTPSTGIRGFRVHGTNVGEITAATRHSPSVIHIELGGDAHGVSRVDYLYGGNPGGVDIHAYADAYVHDDSPLQLPLEGGLLLSEQSP